MNIPQTRIIPHTLAEKLIEKATAGKFELAYQPKKHQLVIEDRVGWLAKIYLPWTHDWIPSGGITAKTDSHFCLVLIRSGQAATGYFHLGKLIDHKVFRAYMIRQKQGFSQIKYMKTKGKSRSGSRIRLAETERFFEEINERLTSYSDRFPIDFWGISCAKTLWPFYFSSAVTPPFSPKDETLIELPVHVAQASLDELIAAGELAQKFHLILSERGREILGESATEESVESVDDSW